MRCALLLRAVNVGGRNRVPMAELRKLLGERTDLVDISTYIASGNIVCTATAPLEEVCTQVRTLIAEEFGVDSPVIARAHEELRRALRANPFPDAAQDRMLHVIFLEGPAAPGAVDALRERLVEGERIALSGRELWIDYDGGGVQGTKLTTSVLDRALGVAGTARNLRTVRKLVELTA
ncbi:DUF1697 domain-containing protein [Microbacterium sp. SD291]|uniref:DUF1697 domain-containing protein n=1 Tax=Microbacterium sp. SD291 TaxID=2782007 RepID=UPI001A9786B8|nr:DUF1697 domain-containing protein [Microbacterium sp. SD291]MBO0979950.1 DUF1697 domain-containing protein [Microbacterium sp. SD291]